MVSDKYVHLLPTQSFDRVKEHTAESVRKSPFRSTVQIAFFKLIGARTAKHTRAVGHAVLSHVKEEGYRAACVTGSLKYEYLGVTKSDHVTVRHIVIGLEPTAKEDLVLLFNVGLC